MNRLYAVSLIFILAQAASAREQCMLARVTVYWSTGISGCDRAQGTGARLHAGHCAVDPEKIPYGSKVFFPDGPCVAVDSGPAVINRKAARLTGRNSRERDAIVIDRFFETKQQALSWEKAHPYFMTVQITDSRQERKEAPEGVGRIVAQINSSPQSTGVDFPGCH
jgi:3D (Asp-Asp-Asp) domain-containing protein